MSADTDTRTGYMLGAVLNAFLLYVVHALPGWDVRVITGDWSAVLYPVTVALGVQVAGNLFLFWKANPFRHRLMHVFFDFTSIAALWRIIRAFPFDFSALGFAAGGTVIRVLLYLALAGVFVGMVSNIVRLLGLLAEEKAQKQAAEQEEQPGEAADDNAASASGGRQTGSSGADEGPAESSPDSSGAPREPGGEEQ